LVNVKYDLAVKLFHLGARTTGDRLRMGFCTTVRLVVCDALSNLRLVNHRNTRERERLSADGAGFERKVFLDDSVTEAKSEVRASG
jgi:hypothetical protein